MKTISVDRLILFAILIVGSFYLFVFPPNSIPDESNHFRAAYQNVNALLGEKSSDVGKLTMRKADASVVFDYPLYPVRSTYDMFRERLFEPLAPEGAEPVQVSRDSGVPHPYIYFPQTLGILLGRAFSANAEWLFMLGRIFNLIFFAVCAWLAVKLAPVGKGVIALVALYPMSMHLAASYNSDTYSIALALLVLGQYLRIAYSEEPAKIRDLFLLLLTMALLGPPKVVFLPMMMLAFFLPTRCFQSKKFAIYFRIIVAVVFLATAYIAYYIYIHRADGGVPVVVMPDTQVNTIANLFADPIGFAKMCKRTITTYFEFYLHSMIGANLGWLEISINKVAIDVFLALSVIGAFRTTAAEKTLMLRDRVQFPVIFMLAALGTAIIMYLSWTPVGNWDIKGIQGRYFLPAWPLFILFAARWRKPVRPAWLSDKTLILIACAMQVFVLVSAYLIISGRDVVNL